MKELAIVVAVLLACVIQVISIVPERELFGESAPTVFWINLESNTLRSHHTLRLLQRFGFHHTVRIGAISPDSPEYNIKMLEKPCKRNTEKDIAVILSHLKAMYQAVNNDPQESNLYALIIEDDIRFLFAVNFSTLIASAPQDFGILQLTTSSPDAIHQLSTMNGKSWHKVNWKDTTKNKKEYLFWSAQAYIIQKSVLREALAFVVSKDVDSKLSFKIVNSFFSGQCSFTEGRPCVLANCLFADTYLYSLGKPTYISSIPLVTGSKIGLNSTIHQAQVEFHKDGFSAIKKVTASVRQCILECKLNKFSNLTTASPSFDCTKCSIPSFLSNSLN
jgi:GR25 family glycosyltransferase involved in LPS biosynthesis